MICGLRHECDGYNGKVMCEFPFCLWYFYKNCLGQVWGYLGHILVISHISYKLQKKKKKETTPVFRAMAQLTKVLDLKIFKRNQNASQRKALLKAYIVDLTLNCFNWKYKFLLTNKEKLLKTMETIVLLFTWILIV